jgi:D-alanyl-D-alanine carboxypeptidase/D-alanyl-D-alanine-endopeptidase (penicillin-binding protein 4)
MNPSVRHLCVLLAVAIAIGAGPAAARPTKKRVAQTEDEPAPAPRPDPRDVKVDRTLAPRLQEATRDILNHPALDGADLGFMVWDVEHNQPLATFGEDTLLNPASNAKLLTSAGALALLGPNFRWRTEYYVTGPIVNGVLEGDLVVKGYGDPTVITERLQAVADELYLQGMRKIRGKILVDDSYFDHDLEARGWEMEEAPDRAYAAPVSGLSLNYNAIGVHVRPAYDTDQPAVVTVDPPVKYAYVEGEMMTARWSRWWRVGSEKDRYRTKIIVGGKLGRRARPAKIFRRVYDPPRYFGSALHLFLNQRGIKVRHVVWRGRVPDGARLVHVDHSPRLNKVIADLNHYSNNFIAETVVKTVAAETIGRPGTFNDGLTAIRGWLETEAGFIPGTYTYGNGSGLNDVNRISPAQFCRLLDTMHDRFDTGPEFEASLAVAGHSGTIRNRMRNGPADARLRAKTGTLTGVSALSGYLLTPRNEMLAFSILVNGWNGREVRTSDIWEIQNRIAEAFASDGETWVPEMEEPEAVQEVAAATSVQGASATVSLGTEPAKGGAP